MYNEERGVSKMDMKLQQVQVLKPQLTQELRQAITLLGYHSAELAEYIDELSLENLLLNERKQTHRHYLTIKQTKTGSAGRRRAFN